MRLTEHGVVYFYIVLHFIHGDGEIKRLKRHAHVERNLHSIDVSVVIQMDLHKNRSIWDAPRHIPSYEQTVLNVEEQLFSWSFGWLSFNYINITTIKTGSTIEPDAIVQIANARGAVNFCIVLNLRHLLWSLNGVCAKRCLHPMGFAVVPFP